MRRRSWLHSKLIRRELGWADEVVGLNSIRIWVELADFQIHANRLFAGFESFLGICVASGRRMTQSLAPWENSPDG